MQLEKIRAFNHAYWNATADDWFGTTALPELGVQFVTEDELHLFGDVAGKTLLEIGCGSGHSLQYLAERGAGELWGLDLSERQLENAQRFLSEHRNPARLICGAMEDDVGLPTSYFDVVYSIYAIGWTIDLDLVCRRIHSYLKPGGTFLFSWKHPIDGCVTVENDRVAFRKSYFDESPERIFLPKQNQEILLQNRKLSTYLNALADAGFRIERVVEQTDAATLGQTGALDDKTKKARLLPLSFVIKARKQS